VCRGVGGACRGPPKLRARAAGGWQHSPPASRRGQPRAAPLQHDAHGAAVRHQLQQLRLDAVGLEQVHVLGDDARSALVQRLQHLGHPDPAGRAGGVQARAVRGRAPHQRRRRRGRQRQAAGPLLPRHGARPACWPCMPPPLLHLLPLLPAPARSCRRRRRRRRRRRPGALATVGGSQSRCAVARLYALASWPCGSAFTAAWKQAALPSVLCCLTIASYADFVA
jgi:hypothetical protein